MVATIAAGGQSVSTGSLSCVSTTITTTRGSMTTPLYSLAAVPRTTQQASWVRAHLAVGNDSSRGEFCVG